ncbi:TRAP transporter small permease subunit [Aquabacterium sp. A08]|uniref:TRAP transporter small permease subunit n=1 Tax=Aquabacterium sp. A08 TaxID=2718532 RepID=UPI00141D7FFB|nr:TRAP transporter small permease subunit [Aquabacterium sp. A08]NIC41778.1 TRAP transporter small permease subunit [Aquabacterium sp. A08]NIC41807.1 TRAP transporter small permease subunit [Aquabacterium sp. A08]
MKSLMLIARGIDLLNGTIGKLAMWLILAATLISAGNAISRKAFNLSSNAFLEIQWYLFAAVFMLGGGYAFLRNAHVRIDVLSGRLSPRARNWIDVVGILVFLFPLCYMLASMGWPVFARAWASGEISSSAGGLVRWPVYGLIPLGFALLALQGLSELIKRLNFLFCAGPDPLSHTGPSETELLAQEIAAAEKAAAGAHK